MSRVAVELERVCACGCGRPLEGMRSDAVYASGACRTRHWKARQGITGIRYLKASQNGSSGRSGLQVSFWRAQRALEEWLEAHDVRSPRGMSIEILEGAMPARQRARLQERKRAEGE